MIDFAVEVQLFV